MSQEALAPRYKSSDLSTVGCQIQHCTAEAGTPPLQYPKLCAQRTTSLLGAHTAVEARGQTTNTRRHNESLETEYSTNVYGSVSSDSSDSVMTPVLSIEFEKSSLSKEAISRKTEQDPEKAVYGARMDSQQHAHEHDTVHMPYLDGEEEDDGRRMPAQKAVKILLFLSGPCILLSSLNAAWACISLVIVFLSQPVRLCARRPTFGQQLVGLLGPTLNLQLRCIYTPLPPYANEDASYHSFMLVAIHILSPFLSFGLACVAWVVAVYWVLSAALGDPGGMDKRDDGRETALALRGWWEAWLMHGVRE